MRRKLGLAYTIGHALLHSPCHSRSIISGRVHIRKRRLQTLHSRASREAVQHCHKHSPVHLTLRDEFRPGDALEQASVVGLQNFLFGPVVLDVLEGVVFQRHGVSFYRSFLLPGINLTGLCREGPILGHLESQLHHGSLLCREVAADPSQANLPCRLPVYAGGSEAPQNPGTGQGGHLGIIGGSETAIGHPFAAFQVDCHNRVPCPVLCGHSQPGSGCPFASGPCRPYASGHGKH